MAAASFGAQASLSFTVATHTTELSTSVDFGLLAQFNPVTRTLTGEALTLFGDADFTFSAPNDSNLGRSHAVRLTSPTEIGFSTGLAAIYLTGTGFTGSRTFKVMCEIASGQIVAGGENDMATPRNT